MTYHAPSIGRQAGRPDAPDHPNASSKIAPPTPRAPLPSQHHKNLDAEPATRLRTSGLHFFHGKQHTLQDISIAIPDRRITALIGPSGCGKSTFLRTFNRMYEGLRGARIQGQILLGEHDVRDLDLVSLRRNIGMVFQKPNPFPKSIFDNVAYGPRISGLARGRELADRVEDCLRKAALWNEVQHKLHASAHALSGGQQQRLCIARALATDPEVLLLDEPCSALDPIATAKIEELLLSLRDTCTLVVVTHNMHQARRIADHTAFFLMGRLIEFNPTDTLFTQPRHQETEDYVTGRFG